MALERDDVVVVHAAWDEECGGPAMPSFLTPSSPFIIWLQRCLRMPSHRQVCRKDATLRIKRSPLGVLDTFEHFSSEMSSEFNSHSLGHRGIRQLRATDPGRGTSVNFTGLGP